VRSGRGVSVVVVLRYFLRRQHGSLALSSTCSSPSLSVARLAHFGIVAGLAGAIVRRVRTAAASVAAGERRRGEEGRWVEIRVRLAGRRVGRGRRLRS